VLGVSVSGSWQREIQVGSEFLGTRDPEPHPGFSFPRTRNPLRVSVPENPESTLNFLWKDGRRLCEHSAVLKDG
jgi:hypothetical protein